MQSQQLGTFWQNNWAKEREENIVTLGVEEPNWADI